MKFLPIFSLTASVALAKSQCGRAINNPFSTRSLNDFIVGGDNARPGAHPWQISLRSSNNGRHFCGGSIISDEYILTAAHCVRRGTEYSVAVGDHRMIQNDPNEEPDSKIIRTEGAIVHPDYSSTTFDNDIALLKLKEKIVFTDFVQPICLHQEDMKEPDNAYATGWGATTEGSAGANILQEVKIPIITNQQCENAYGFDIKPSMICAGDLENGGIDACQGDSGGPFAYKNTVTNQWTLIGVVSWGIGCARPNNPGVYARVSQFTDWIETNSGVVSEIENVEDILRVVERCWLLS